LILHQYQDGIKFTEGLHPPACFLVLLFDTIPLSSSQQFWWAVGMPIMGRDVPDRDTMRKIVGLIFEALGVVAKPSAHVTFILTYSTI